MADLSRAGTDVEGRVCPSCGLDCCSEGVCCYGIGCTKPRTGTDTAVEWARNVQADRMASPGLKAIGRDVLALSAALEAAREVIDGVARQEVADIPAVIELRAELEAARQERDEARRERDEVYAVNASANYDRANAAENALEEITVLCDPGRVPLPLLNSTILRVIRGRDVEEPSLVALDRLQETVTALTDAMRPHINYAGHPMHAAYTDAMDVLARLRVGLDYGSISGPSAIGDVT